LARVCCWRKRWLAAPSSRRSAPASIPTPPARSSSLRPRLSCPKRWTRRTAAAPGSKTALPAALDPEDRRRALGALAVALDPQGNGAAVRWDNPVSKAHGLVTPLGYAYPSNDLICRHFSAEFATTVGNQTEQGAACRDKNAQWTLSELRPGQEHAVAPLRDAELKPK
jgi:hypothetical protein